MICTPNALMELAQQLQGIPQRALRSVMVYLACQWANGTSPVEPYSFIVIRAPSGGYWQVIVDPSGLVGAQHAIGPDTPPIIMDDGTSNFWRVIVDDGGLLGTQSDPGPASLGTRIDDGTSNFWKLIVDTSGNLGTEPTP